MKQPSQSQQHESVLHQGENSNMKLTVFIVALDVAEESAEAGTHGCIQLHPVHRGAHPFSGMVGADFIVLSLQHTHTHTVFFNY